MAEPEALQKATDIGAVNQHPARLKCGTQFVQRQFS